MDTKLYTIIYPSSYGEVVVLIEAINPETALSLFQEKIHKEAYEVEIEEITLTGNQRIISIKGGY